MKNAKKRPIILYEYGTVRKLADEFGCTQRAVSNALRFVSDSERAAQIREACITKYGGKITSKPIM